MLNVQDNCLHGLILDYISNGICEVPSDIAIFPFEPLKENNCTFITSTDGQIIGIEVGVCSSVTEDLLLSREMCGFSLREQTNLIFYTLDTLLMFMCNSDSAINLIQGVNIDNARYPFESVYEFEDATISTNFNPTNTRHRYPWICSLRSKGTRSNHYCALTLLSRPPAPTVLVGPAHCTYLCKSSRGEVDNCCCGGPTDCSDNIERCGKNPRVVEMTGQDAEILFGEWETGDAPQESSGEKYNVVLSINEIKRHPDYIVNINSSGYLQNDIAVFKVDSSPLTKVCVIKDSK